MFIRLVVSASLAFWALSGTSSAEDAQAAPYRGVNVYFTGSDAVDIGAIEALLEDLETMRVNTILLTFPVYIDGLMGHEIGRIIQGDGDGIIEGANSPSDFDLQVFVDTARARGFGVWLRPLLDEGVLMAEGSWRGELAPADPGAFFDNYAAMLAGLVTGVTGIDWLILGTEFNSLQQPIYDAFWSGMITTLRDHPASEGVRFTYASNWQSAPYPPSPPWFSMLDAISVDAWFPANGLTDTATSAEIATALAAWTEELRAFTFAMPELPLFVTELGIASQAMIPSVLQQPWQWPREELPPAPEVQARFAEGSCAFYTGVTNSTGAPLVEGIFWWVTSVGHAEDPLLDRSFDFVNKPAEAAITTCFENWTW